jgi:hypothetical protein
VREETQTEKDTAWTQKQLTRLGSKSDSDQKTPVEGRVNKDSRGGQENKTPVEGRVNKTPERFKRIRLQ